MPRFLAVVKDWRGNTEVVIGQYNALFGKLCFVSREYGLSRIFPCPELTAKTFVQCFNAYLRVYATTMIRLDVTT